MSETQTNTAKYTGDVTYGEVTDTVLSMLVTFLSDGASFFALSNADLADEASPLSNRAQPLRQSALGDVGSISSAARQLLIT